MDFLFRTPLLTFNPKDRDSIQSNWKYIVKAIENSSSDFANSIRGKELEDLSVHQYRKVLKYLLRGRYRATPFGYWSGIGLGYWSKSYSEIDLTTKLIKKEQAFSSQSENEINRPHYLAVGIRRDLFHYTFWSYEQNKEGWLMNFLSRSKIPDLIFDWFQYNSELTFNQFLTWFSKSNTATILGIWEKLKDAGLIISKQNHEKMPVLGHGSIDLKVIEKLSLPYGIKDQLEIIPNEMGGLFGPFNTNFLAKFSGWFVDFYDDRFVRLDQIMSSRRFFPSCISKPVQNEPISEMDGSFWDYSQEIDLKKTFGKKKIQNISQLQMLFRIGSGEKIFVENFTCNNPFALMGRFGNDEEIASYFKKSNSPYQSQEVLYADILIHESKKSQVICSHLNLFEHAIDCTGQLEGKGVIPLSDLWLGMDDGKFKIVSRSLNKQVIPIVQHPLNPAFISHPMCRVLWEIAQQDSFRFQLHTNSILSKGKFSPKFTWGDICLQRPIWTVSSYDIKEKGSLKQLKELWHIPDVISFGNNDRELILDLNDPIDCSIFHQEIVSNKTCTISTAEWINNSPIRIRPGNCVFK